MERKIGVVHKPWLDVHAPREIYLPNGMLGGEERRLLFWAGLHFQGRGTVVDAGAFAGASAYCLACGLERSPRNSSPLARVHSYDMFKIKDQTVFDHISKHFYPAKMDDDFRDVFEFQTGKYRHRIDTHQGNFLTLDPPSDDVEILFVDIAKTAELNQKVLTDYFPKLIPGVSLLIQQDFYQAWHPYIHASMVLLDPYFELVDPFVEGASRVWQLKQSIPTSALAVAADPARPADETLELLDRAITAETIPDVASAMQVGKLLTLLQAGRSDEARALDRTLPAGSGTFWSDHLAAIRAIYAL
jgi:hypothetical protein